MPQKLLIRQDGDFRQYEPKDSATGAVAGDVVALNSSAKIDTSLITNGLPIGGVVDQVLAKSTTTNFAAKWVTLGSAAYAATSDFATAAQGAKADNAVLLTGNQTVAGTKTYSNTNVFNLGLRIPAENRMVFSDGTKEFGSVRATAQNAMIVAAGTADNVPGQIFLRPNGNTVQTAQVVINSNGSMNWTGDAASKTDTRTSLGAVGNVGAETIAGTKTFLDDVNVRATKNINWVNAAGDTVHGSMTTTGANQVVIGAGPSGTIYFRPQGAGTTSGQCSITANGTMTFGNALATRQGLGAVGLTGNEVINGSKRFTSPSEWFLGTTGSIETGTPGGLVGIVGRVGDPAGGVNSLWRNDIRFGAGFIQMRVANAVGSGEGPGGWQMDPGAFFPVQNQVMTLGKQFNSWTNVFADQFTIRGNWQQQEATISSLGVQQFDRIPPNSNQERWIRIATLPWSGNGASQLAFSYTHGQIGHRRIGRDLVSASVRGFSDTTTELTAAVVAQIVEVIRIGDDASNGSPMRVGLTLNKDGDGKSTGVDMWINQRVYNNYHSIERQITDGVDYYGRRMAENTQTTEPTGVVWAIHRMVNSSVINEVVQIGGTGATLRGSPEGSMVMASNGSSTGGSIFLRPNGNANPSGQTAFYTDGSVILDSSVSEVVKKKTRDSFGGLGNFGAQAVSGDSASFSVVRPGGEVQMSLSGGAYPSAIFYKIIAASGNRYRTEIQGGDGYIRLGGNTTANGPAPTRFLEVGDGTVRPSVDNSMTFGTDAFRWSNIRAVGAQIDGTVRINHNTPGVWYNETDGDYSIYQVLDGNIMQWQNRNTPFGSTINNMPMRFHLVNQNIEIDFNIVPRTDNKATLGTTSLRMKEIAAVNGTINTSDGRLKTDPRKFNDDEVEAFMEISRLPGIWQWLERVQEVGEDVARLHCGPVVQQAISIMDRYLLDWTRYSMFCYDQWDAVPEVLGKLPDEFDAEGILVKEGEPYVLSEAIEAGDRYSFRATELLYAISFAQTATLDKQAVNLADLQSRVSVIEKKLSSL